MTHEEMERYRQRLIEIVQTSDSGQRNKALIELRNTIGAGGCGSGSVGEHDARNIAAIHEALQTGSMIDACRTAAKNHEIAMKAQESARLSQWVSIAAMLAAVASAMAAWIAAMRS